LFLSDCTGKRKSCSSSILKSQLPVTVEQTKDKFRYSVYTQIILCLNDFPKEKYFIGTFIEFVFNETESKFIKIEDGEYCG